MFPFFVLVLSSGGKCKALCIMRGSLLEKEQEAESMEAKRGRRKVGLPERSFLAGIGWW